MALATAIARGVTEGVQGYGENMRRAAIAEREDKRFQWEEQDQAEKQRVRDATKEFGDQMRLAREQFATGKLPGLEDNLVEQQPVEQAAPRQAIGVPGAAPAPVSAAPADATPRTENIFKSNGEGLYKDQRRANEAYWGRLRDITAAYYEKTGQVDKLMDVDKKINEWKNSAYDELRKATAAAVATGDPDALKMASRLADMTGLGFKVDPTSGKFDPKTQTYVGVKMTGADGKEVVQDLSAARLLTVIGQLSPEKLIEFNVARADKERQFGIEDRKVGADELRARAYASTARDNAETNRDTRETNAAIRKRQQEVREDEAAAKLFGSSFGVKEFEVKTKDEVEAMMPKQREAYEASRAEQTKRRELASYAQNIYSLNERAVPPAQITQLIPALQRRISSGKGADGIDTATGLPFVNFNGKKILLPKD